MTANISGLTIRNGHGTDGSNATGQYPYTDTNFVAATAGVPGGGIYNAGTLTMNNCVVSNNTAGKGGNGLLGHDYIRYPDFNTGQNGGSGEGVYNNYFGMIFGTQVINSLIALNQASGSGPDVSGNPYQTLGHNLIGIASPSTGFVNGMNGDLVGSAASPVNPMIGLLSDNGGPTRTHGLLLGSPAINAGANSGAPVTDQRGYSRIVGGVIDIGAFEFQGRTPPQFVANSYQSVGAGGGCWMKFVGLPTTNYIVQASTNLVVWTDLVTLTTGWEGFCEYNHTDATNYPLRFYG